MSETLETLKLFGTA